MKKTIVFILLTTLSFSMFAGDEIIVQKNKESKKDGVLCRHHVEIAVTWQCSPGVTIVTDKPVITTYHNCLTGAQVGLPVTTSHPTGNTCPNTTIDWISDQP